MRRTLTQSTKSLAALAERTGGEVLGGCGTPLEGLDNEAEDAEALWGGVQEVVLCYARQGSIVEQVPDDGPGKRPSKSPTTGDCLKGPPLSTVSAYSLLLGWVHGCGGLMLKRRCIFDPGRLLDIKDRALQIAELDALLGSPFDGEIALHRQLAFSVFAKFTRLGDPSARPASCGRTGEHWEAMGFQRQDFATDLRGVGILGLLHLLSFFGSYPVTARTMLQCNAEREARHGENGAVPIACASLNFSSLAILALREGRLSRICRRAKSVHGAVLQMHAALMSAFVRRFRSRPDATVLAFDEILQELKHRAHTAPSYLLQELQEKAPADERQMACSFAAVRPLPLEEPARPPASPLSATEARHRVRAASLTRPGGLQSHVLAQASDESPAAEVEAVFRMVCRGSEEEEVSNMRATLEDLRFFLCDALGCEAAEVSRFVRRVDKNGDGHVGLEEFRRGFQLLNSHRISHRERESFLRRPGTIRGQQFSLEDLSGCEVHVLDHVACCTVDNCNSCEIVVGPSEASVFVRDCEDCTFYLVAQQLRTRRCKRCSFFLFCGTEPIIEMSSSLRFAPLALSYPGLADQVQSAGLDPSRNLWNAIFDFNSRLGHRIKANQDTSCPYLLLPPSRVWRLRAPCPDNCQQNWTLAELAECQQYSFQLDCLAAAPTLSAADAAVFPTVTEAVLHAAPLKSGLDTGTRVDVP